MGFASSLTITSMKDVFLQLEKKHQAQIGVYALDLNTNNVISNRENEAFPFQSTFKLIAVAALMASMPEALEETVTIKKQDLVPWGPISYQYLNKEVSYKTLAKASIAHSDNPAINLIIKRLGGINKVNQFVKRLGKQPFNLKHIEVNLNSNPKVLDDTSTPLTMAEILNKILFSDVLSEHNQTLLKDWMKDNITGYKRIRSGVPLGFTVADKTGSGSYGIANDIGFVYSESCKPILLSLFTKKADKNAPFDDALIASITEKVMTSFSKTNDCFKVIPSSTSGHSVKRFSLVQN
jgi:beta-lactamase class A